MNEKENIIKGGYLVEVLGCDRKKVLWGVLDDRVVEEKTDNDDIGLQGFNFNFFDKYEKGFIREGSHEFSYLIILIKLWPGYWKTQAKRINLKVDEYNGKSMVIENGRYRKFCRFSGNDFFKNIGCLVSAPTFGLGG